MHNGIWPKRLFALDVSRGFAALAVVFWHWQHFAYNGISPPSNFDRESQPLYAVFKIFYEKGAMGVDYFFILSGFIFFWLYKTSIADKTTGFGNFWLQRFSRLYPLHFVTLAIVALLQFTYITHNGNPFVYPFNDTYHFLLNVGFASKWGLEDGLSFNAPIWSVSIEVLLYLIFFAIAYSGKSGLGVCLGVSALSFIAAQFIHHAIFRGLAMFFLGGAVYQLSFIITAQQWRKTKIAIYIMTPLFWILCLVNFYIFNIADLVLRIGFIGKAFLAGFPGYILFPLTICSLALAEIDRGHFLKPISWFGDITYSSYLLHFPLQMVFVLLVSYGVLNAEFYMNTIYFVIFFSLLISLSYVTYIGFERPIQNLIRNKFR